MDKTTKKVDMPKRKNKYIADKLGELSTAPTYGKGNVNGTFGNLYQKLKNKV